MEQAVLRRDVVQRCGYRTSYEPMRRTNENPTVVGCRPKIHNCIAREKFINFRKKGDRRVRKAKFFILRKKSKANRLMQK